MVEVSLGPRYTAAEPVRTELKIPLCVSHFCRGPHCRIGSQGPLGSSPLRWTSRRLGRHLARRRWRLLQRAGAGKDRYRCSGGGRSTLARQLADPGTLRDPGYPVPPLTSPERLPSEAPLPARPEPQIRWEPPPGVAPVDPGHREDQPALHVAPVDVLPGTSPKLWLSAAPSGWWTAFTWIRNVGLVIGLFVVWQLWGTAISQHHEQHHSRTPSRRQYASTILRLPRRRVPR